MTEVNRALREKEGNVMNEQAYFVDTPWTWRERLRFKLFPSRHCSLPDAPATHLDCVVIKTIVVLGWLDRLRVLASGRMTVETKTVTEHIVGAAATASVAYPSLHP